MSLSDKYVLFRKVRRLFTGCESSHSLLSEFSGLVQKSVGSCEFSSEITLNGSTICGGEGERRRSSDIFRFSKLDAV